ncbi:histamine N-methyltransferase-like [Branchiostoma floridae]|uniref:Histamine N-methyltransferase-like n=1 Tax=Branchiostoma floridae TaxID=7739 RepID=A0A9J7N2A4_BRAFL|nr:histamine N-methyltransferase-like [Branchiostoma floridae]XP_035686851.1 histamine N-methyltransferase-like [Branchiostoma floridae]
MENFGRLVKDFPEQYLTCFKAYKASIEKKDRDNFNHFYRSTALDAILCDSGTDARVLGIGSGSGEVDSIILKKLLQRHNSVYNRVVEPAEDLIERYKARVREDTSLQAVEFDWRQQTAEEYFLTEEPVTTTFNLVHAVHVLYHVKDLHATLRNMWEQLADGGHMVVQIKSDNGVGGRLYDKMWEHFGEGDRLKSVFRMSCDIKEWLDNMGIGYDTSEEDTNINVTECFKENSETGMRLLEFFTLTPYIANEPELRSTVLEYIRNNSSVVGDQVYFKSVSEVVVAHKKQ